jgi:hypothetical protein
VSQAILEGKTYVIGFDLRTYFDTVEKRLREELAKTAGGGE